VSKVFPWYSVSESVIEASSEDVLSRAPLNKKLTDAMKAGTLKIYDKNAALLPQTTDIDLSHYLNPIEVNKWLSLNDLPYRWEPALKFKSQTLQERLDSGELKEEALRIVQHLKSIGTRDRLITPALVASGIAKMPAWGYEESTLAHAIRAGWWKKHL
jgi:nicotinic acid phosphoribosyltransferase